MFSQSRDLAAATPFFARARKAAGRTPERVTTGGHDAYPRAIPEILGPEVTHRRSRLSWPISVSMHASPLHMAVVDWDGS